MEDFRVETLPGPDDDDEWLAVESEVTSFPRFLLITV